MENFESRLKNAFDSVSAEDALKKSAGAYVRGERQKRNRNVSRNRRFRPAAGLLCMLLVFFGGYFTRAYLEPVSVISIDINPSIELGVNTFDHVIRVDAFNEDGRQLTQQLQLRFMNYEKAVDRIVTSEKVSGLLERDEELVITVVGKDARRNEMLCSSLETYTKSGENSRCYSASPDLVEKAHSCGMSYGKYLAYQKAQQQDPTLTAEETQDMTMKEIHETTETTCETEAVPTESVQHHGHGSNKHNHGHH